jgi:hypothetical protein
MKLNLHSSPLGVISAGLILSISFSLLAAPTGNAAVKLNGACTKVNSSTTIKGVKLTCTKVGSKSTWKKKVEVSTYALGPTGRLVYRYVDGKQQRLDTGNKWQSTDSRATSDFDAIRASAYKSIIEMKSDPKLTNVTVTYLIQPNYPKDVAEAVKQQSLQVAARLSPLLEKNLEIKLILVTEKDKEFIGKDLNKLIPGNDWLRQIEQLNDYGTIEQFYSRGGTGGGSAFYLKDKDFGYYVGHTSSLATLATYWPEIAPHEIAHVLQGVLADGVDTSGQQFGEGDPRARWQGHLIEGSANTLGMAWGFEQLGWYSDEMDFLLKRDIQAFQGKITMKNEADAVKFIQTIESRNNEFGGFAYSAGQFVWEFYVGKYGAPKLIELFRNLPKTENFNENLKKTIGKDRDAFYKEAAPYLLATWKRLS